MKKLFAYDLDGTLFTHANNMHESTYPALLEVQKNGHYNAVCTGRALNNIINALGEKINAFSHIIGSNGTVIYNVANKNVTLLGKVDPKVFEYLFTIAKKHDFSIRIDTIFESKTYLNSTQKPKWLEVQNVMDITSWNIASEDELKKFVETNKDKIVQIALRGFKEEIFDAFNKVNIEIGKNYCVKYTNEVYLDINALNINKFSGLSYVANELGIQSANVYSFGDSGNDIDMLIGAGVGVAMGNATQEAKNAADIIIKSNQENSISEFLLKNIE